MFGERNDPAFLTMDDISVNSDTSAVPEPATMTMLGIGLAGLVGYGVRRHKQRAASV